MNNKEKRTGSFDDLPMSLNADDISSVLNMFPATVSSPGSKSSMLIGGS